MDDVCVSRQGTSEPGSAPVDREVSMHTTVALRTGNDVRTGSGRCSADSHLLFVRPWRAQPRATKRVCHAEVWSSGPEIAFRAELSQIEGLPASTTLLSSLSLLCWRGGCAFAPILPPSHSQRTAANLGYFKQHAQSFCHDLTNIWRPRQQVPK